MIPLENLPAFADDGDLQVIVESPRGSTLKLAYENDWGGFAVSRALPLGIAYPYDWGFIPGTVSAHGDPLDALVLSERTSFPGVLIRCTAIGMVRLTDTDEGRRRANNRIIAVPAWNQGPDRVRYLRDLSVQVRLEIERFLLNTTYFTAKNARIQGWSSQLETDRFIRRSMVDQARGA